MRRKVYKDALNTIVGHNIKRQNLAKVNLPKVRGGKKPDPVATFTLESSTASINEGSNFTITLKTELVKEGTILPYTIDGIDDNDIAESLKGNFIIQGNGIATATFNVVEDIKTEGNETFILSLDNGQASQSVIIVDTSRETYTLTSNKLTTDEGGNFTITLATIGVQNNTLVGYTIDGIDDNDIAESTTGNFTVNNNTATATFNVVEDLITETNETFVLRLDNGRASQYVNIVDTSRETYTLTSQDSGGNVIYSVNEGDNFTIKLTTQGVVDNTLVGYSISGIQDADIVESRTGNFTINNNTATATFNVVADSLTDASEVFLLTLNNNKASRGVAIIDTSINATYNITSKVTDANTGLQTFSDTANEGDIINFALTTTGLPNGTHIDYIISGSVDGDDFNNGSLSNTGTFIIPVLMNNSYTPIIDFDNSEGSETMTMSLVNGQASKTVTINNVLNETYNLESDKVSVDEGGSFTITLATQGIAQNTAIPYTISGVSPSDISGVSLTGGNFTIGANGTATATFNVTSDFTTETNETFVLSLNNGQDSVSVTIVDTSKETYVLTAEDSGGSTITSVNEGSSFIVKLTTQGVAENTTLGYTIDGIDDNDISESTAGNFTIGADGTATATFNVVADSLTETTETFILTLDNGKDDISIDINDTSVNVSYSLASNVNSTQEGGNFTITLTTQGVATGEALPYTISGVSPSDIDGVSLTGGIFYPGVDGTATVTFNVSEDLTVELPETFVLTLNNNAAQVSVTILDVYELTSNKTLVDEGGNFIVTLKARGFTSGAQVGYSISGIQDADIVESRTGNFTVGTADPFGYNNATATFNVVADQLTDAGETLRLTLDDNTSVFVDVAINDTSIPVTYDLEKTGGNGFGFNNANEGSKIRMYLYTTGLARGTVVPCTIGGTVDVNDFEAGFDTSTYPTHNYIVGQSTGVDGNASLDPHPTRGDVSLVVFKIKNDLILEGTETFTMTVDADPSVTETFPISDTSVPTYSLSVDPPLNNNSPVVNEGGNFTIRLTTTGVAQSTSVGYSVGGIDAADIVESTTGNFTIGADGTATATFNVVEDLTTEGEEDFILLLDNDEDYIEVAIRDTSFSPVYTLVSDKQQAIEGGDFTITLNTEGVPDNTTVGYAISGIQNADILEFRRGNFTVVNGTATKTFNVVEDFTYSAGASLQLNNSIDSPMTSPGAAGASGGGDQFGVHTSFNATGDRVAVGSNDDPNQANLQSAGTVRVYEYSNSNNAWTQLGNDIIGTSGTFSDPNGFELARVVALNGVGDIVAVGAQMITSSSGVNYPGKVRIYKLIGNNWTQLGSTINGEQDGDKFGFSIAINKEGNIVAVGAPEHTVSANNTGQVKVYRDTTGSGNWVQRGNPYSSEVDDSKNFGGCVILDAAGNTLGVSSFKRTGSNTFASRVNNYAADVAGGLNGTTEERRRSNAPDIYPGYPTTGALDSIPRIAFPDTGAQVVIGEPGEDFTANDAGQVSVYGISLIDNDPTNVEFLLSGPVQSGTAGSRTGYSVDISDDLMKVVVGSPYSRAGGLVNSSAGYVTIYDFSLRNTLDTMVGNQYGSAFGTSVSMDKEGNIIVVGAPNYNAVGRVQTYDINKVEGNEYFKLELDNGEASKTVTIADTSRQTFNLQGVSTISEGESFTITLNTQGVADNLLIGYTISGIQDADINESLTGEFITNNNTATATFNVTSDFTTESNEPFKLELDNGKASHSVTINDTSTEIIIPLNVLFLGREYPFDVRSQDTKQLYNYSTYLANPAALDTIIDSDVYDMIVLNNVDWEPVSGESTLGVFHANTTTYDKLKEFVARGGTIYDYNEHGGYRHYENNPLPYPQTINYSTFQPLSRMFSGTGANLVYDLGGITAGYSGAPLTENRDWKIRSYDGRVGVTPTQIALDNDVVNPTGHQVDYVQNIITQYAKGMPILAYNGSSTSATVYMWNGSMPAIPTTGSIPSTRPDHFNNGVFGKIIFSGDSGVLFQGTFQDHGINPMLDYIARTKVDYNIGINGPGGTGPGNYNWNLGGTDRNGVVNGPSWELAFNVGDKIRIQWTYGRSSDVIAHPLYIKTQQGSGTGNQASGVTGAGTATLEWTPETAGTYYYQCKNHDEMYGKIIVT